MTVLGAAANAAAAAASAIRTATQPAPVVPLNPRLSVRLDLPCPSCGVTVGWIGSRVDGDGTAYRFTGPCNCPQLNEEAA